MSISPSPSSVRVINTVQSAFSGVVARMFVGAGTASETFKEEKEEWLGLGRDQAGYISQDRRSLRRPDVISWLRWLSVLWTVSL